MIETSVVETHVLTKDRVAYYFKPSLPDETVAVRRVEGRHANNYELPVEEARQLYRNLRKKGYERF